MLHLLTLVPRLLVFMLRVGCFLSTTVENTALTVEIFHVVFVVSLNEVDMAMGVFPNPASDVATFRYQLDMDAQVELTLVDLAGRQVAVLLDANKGAGAHAETLTLPSVPAGPYNVKLRVAGEVAGTQRLVVTH